MGKQQKIIGSVQRAIDILGLFDVNNSEMGVTEIANSLGLPKSTVAGLIITLEKNQYLAQNPISRKYGLGWKLVERAGVFLDQIDLIRIAEPIMEALRNMTNESVNLAVRDGQHVVYISRILSDNMLRMRSEVGKREPVHSTALGKALISRMSSEALSMFVRKYEFVYLTERTITDRSLFVQEVDEIRLRGYALDNEENEIGGRCVAAPIINYRGDVSAAIGISAPVQRFSEKMNEEYGELVKRVADQISIRIGAKF